MDGCEGGKRTNSYGRKRMKFKYYLLIVPVIIVMFGVTGYPDSVVTVIRKSETHRGNYLIFTDSGTLENTDNYLFLKFSSSDLISDIEKFKGKEAVISKVGWRIPIFSWYENILSVKLNKKEE